MSSSRSSSRALRRRWRWGFALTIAASAAAAAGPLAAGPPAYQPPVDAPIADPFRPPSHPYGPGNRGIEYDTEPGAPVAAAGAGTVTFAGPVAGSLHVTIGHPDGVRTTYAFLATVAVAEGRRVSAGEVVGTAGERLHFGARVGTTYIDPMTLFAAGPPRVRLVPESGSARSGRLAPASDMPDRLALPSTAPCARLVPTRSGGHGCGRE